MSIIELIEGQRVRVEVVTLDLEAKVFNKAGLALASLLRDHQRAEYANRVLVCSNVEGEALLGGLGDSSLEASSVGTSKAERFQSVLGVEGAVDGADEAGASAEEDLLLILPLLLVLVLPHVVSSLFVAGVAALDAGNELAAPVQVDFDRNYFGGEVLLAEHCAVGEALALRRQHSHLVVLQHVGDGFGFGGVEGFGRQQLLRVVALVAGVGPEGVQGLHVARHHFAFHYLYFFLEVLDFLR